jgi:hypothetical protein
MSSLVERHREQLAFLGQAVYFHHLSDVKLKYASPIEKNGPLDLDPRIPTCFPSGN